MKAAKKYWDYRVITEGNELDVRAVDYGVGFFGVSFYNREGDIIHWFKKKEVCAVILKRASECE